MRGSRLCLAQEQNNPHIQLALPTCVAQTKALSRFLMSNSVLVQVFIGFVAIIFEQS
jgi:hypothetical protein